MGKILSGILGPVSGKIGGVVGGRWKNVPYLRSYTVPGASNTDLQIAQRARFAYIVAAGKPFVGRVFNAYYDKFLSKQSGFNRFISENILTPPDTGDVDNPIVTDGPLYPASGLDVGDDTINDKYLINWNTELGVDGSADDVAISWFRNASENTVVFCTDGVRSDGAAEITYAAWSHTEHATEGGVFFAKMNGALVVKISRNLSGTAVVLD